MKKKLFALAALVVALYDGRSSVTSLAASRDDLATLRDDTELPPIHGTWLITRVAFHRSREGGTTPRLRLVPVGAIRVFPTEAA